LALLTHPVGGTLLRRNKGKPMSGTVLEEIELIIEDVHGNNGGKPPSRDGDDGGDDENGPDGSAPEPQRSREKQYETAIAIGMVSIVVFFLVLTALFIALRAKNLHTWSAIHLPAILWLNTGVLLASSATLEVARRRLRMDNANGFRRMWTLTTVLGLVFLAGQVIAWSQLAAEGAYDTSRLASGFFYVFTALHAAHLLAGIFALIYVGWRGVDSAYFGKPPAVQVASFYWHFLDGLWLFLLALLYLGR